MHSTDGNTEGITFHHNGDFSGDVIININDDGEFKHDVVEYWPPNEEFKLPGYWKVTVPFEDIKGLVADYVRNKKIEALEEVDDEELLNG